MMKQNEEQWSRQAYLHTHAQFCAANNYKVFNFHGYQMF